MRQAKRQLLDEQFHAQFPEVEQPPAAGSSSTANPDFLAGVAAPTIRQEDSSVSSRPA